MFKKNDSGMPDRFDTLVGDNTTIEGNLLSEGTVKIDGKVKGDLKVNGDLFIGSNAFIKGNITANNVYLSGSVEGNIQAAGLLKLLSTARLFGDIQVKSFVADEGGLFQGKCSMLEGSEVENIVETTSSKKGTSSRDYKKSSVLVQSYDEKNSEA